MSLLTSPAGGCKPAPGLPSSLPVSGPQHRVLHLPASGRHIPGAWINGMLGSSPLGSSPKPRGCSRQPLALTDGRGGRGSPRTLCGPRVSPACPRSPAPAGTSLGKDGACRVGWGLPQLPQGRCHPRNLSLCKYWGCGELAAHPAALPPPRHSADVHRAAANCEMNCQSAELSFE